MEIRTGQEASLAILGYLAVLFAYSRLRPAGLIAALGGIAVIWINGSRAVLLATALLLVVTALLKLTSALPRAYRRQWSIPHVAGVVTLLLIAAVAVKDVPIHMPDHDTSLHELVEAPLEHIVSLRLSSNYTSVDVRANLAIAGLRALYDTAFLGIGPGNSRAITARFYAPRLVTSFHNFLMQCVAEYGLLALAAFALLLTFVVRRRVNPQAIAGIGALTLGTFGTAASVFSNFYFLSCLFLLLLAPPAIDVDEAGAWARGTPEARPL
ncbi:MAG: O-antigen ligase family protein [Acidobacteria bacterium]|nr:O-antigen ligase family protein [Acidobacteriota bacterium]